MKRTTPILIPALLALSASLRAQEPVARFFVLPDDNGAAGSESMVSGTIPGPGGLPAAVAFDFAAPLTVNEPGYLNALRGNPVASPYTVLDARFEGFDPSTGASMVLTCDRNSSGTLSTTGPGGSFPTGAQVTLSLPVVIAVSGGGFGPGVPALGLLTASGTLVPGFYHQVVLLTGTIDTLPQITVSLHVKQDLLPPGVQFVYVADTAVASATRTGGSPESLQGSLTLARDPVDHRIFTLGPVAFILPSAPLFGIAATAGLGGTLTLDPVTRTISGSITWTFNGVPATRVLDGSGEVIEGAATAPTGLRIFESGLPGLQDLDLRVRRVELVPGGSTAAIGQTYQPLFRSKPGAIYALAASLDPAPGLSTAVGDVPVEIDLLFTYSIDPANAIFFGFIGTAPTSGEVHPQIVIPNVPLLAGFTFFLGGINLDSQSGTVIAVTNSHRVIL